MSDFSHFYEAQNDFFEIALTEIKNSQKVSHWIWFIFPQLKALGKSSTAEYFGIENLAEAREYLSETTLKNRLIEISQALLEQPQDDIIEIVGKTDAKKIKSCMTLFLLADPNEEIYLKVLNRFYNGEQDNRTIDILKNETE